MSTEREASDGLPTDEGQALVLRPDRISPTVYPTAIGAMAAMGARAAAGAVLGQGR